MFLLACTAPKPAPDDSLDASLDDSVDASTTDTVGDSPADSTTDSESPGESDDSAQDTEHTGDTGEPPPGVPLPDLKGMSVLYLHVDTLRRDHLAAYGYGRETLPLTGGLPWLVVEGAYSESSWTLPATASVLTGTREVDHGVGELTTRAGLEFVKLDVPTVAGHLADQGWASAAFEGNPWLSEFTDMTASFDLASHIEKQPDRPSLLQLVDHATKWLASVPPEQPFLLWLQPMDMHLPYQISKDHQYTYGDGHRRWDLASFDEVAQTRQIETSLLADPEGARQDLYDTYDEALLDLDQGIAAALDMLEAAGRLDTTIVVLSADHGETLDDTQAAYIGHGATLRQELVRNPLLLLVPGGEGARVDCAWQNIDAWPTLLDALGLPPLKTARGTSRRHDCRDVTVSMLWADEDQPGWIIATDSVEKLQRTCDGTGESGWDLVNDPGELTPVAPSALAREGELRAAIEEALAEVVARYPKASCVP